MRHERTPEAYNISEKARLTKFFRELGGAFSLQKDMVGYGIDIREIDKVRKKIEQRPRTIVLDYTDEEIVYCEQGLGNRKWERYATRFAAKEAVIKSLGGISRQGFSFRDIHILRGESGQLYVYLTGRPEERARELNVAKFFLSTTDEGNYTAAFCIAVR